MHRIEAYTRLAIIFIIIITILYLPILLILNMFLMIKNNNFLLFNNSLVLGYYFFAIIKKYHKLSYNLTAYGQKMINDSNIINMIPKNKDIRAV